MTERSVEDVVERIAKDARLDWHDEPARVEWALERLRPGDPLPDGLMVVNVGELDDLRERISSALAVLPGRKNPPPDAHLQRLVNLAIGLLGGDDG